MRNGRLHWALGVMALLVVLSGLGYWRSRANQPSQPAQTAYRQWLLAGLGKEVQFVTAATASDEIDGNVRSVGRFIERRSGLKIHEAALTRLADLERSMQLGSLQAVSATQLGEIASEAVLWRVARLTDEEIESAARILCGFSHPEVPDELKTYRDQTHVKVPGMWGKWFPDYPYLRQEFAEALRLVQQKVVSGDAGARTHCRLALSDMVATRTKFLAANLPESFEGTWDLEMDRATDSGLRPLQALIVYYSALSTDTLDGEARAKINALHQELSRRFGHYPSPDGYFAYGANGYLCSTPLNLFLDEATLAEFLNRLVEGSRS